VKTGSRVICTLAHGPHLELLDVTGPALARYAARHGYEFVALRHRLEPSRPVAWDKVVLLHDLVARYDTVVWVDADAIVLPGAPDIAEAMRPRKFLHLVEHRTQHGRVPNSGVMALRGGRTAARFLRRVWDQPRFVHALWWENAAVMHLLGYREFPKMRPAIPSAWRAGVGFIDRAWNSIPPDCAPHPHIVHFPGVDLDERKRELTLLAAQS
jgi:hypothetical protein